MKKTKWIFWGWRKMDGQKINGKLWMEENGRKNKIESYDGKNMDGKNENYGWKQHRRNK